MAAVLKINKRIEKEQKRIARTMGIGVKKEDLPPFPIRSLEDFRELETKIQNEESDSPFLVALVRRLTFVFTCIFIFLSICSQQNKFVSAFDQKVGSLGNWVHNPIWPHYTTSSKKLQNKKHVLDSPFFALVLSEF